MGFGSFFPLRGKSPYIRGRRFLKSPYIIWAQAQKSPYITTEPIVTPERPLSDPWRPLSDRIAVCSCWRIHFLSFRFQFFAVLASLARASLVVSFRISPCLVFRPVRSAGSVRLAVSWENPMKPGFLGYFAHEHCCAGQFRFFRLARFAREGQVGK